MIKRIRKFFGIVATYLWPSDKELKTADEEMRNVIRVDVGSMSEQEALDVILGIQEEKKKGKCGCGDCKCRKPRKPQARRSRRSPTARTHRGSKAGGKR